MLTMVTTYVVQLKARIGDVAKVGEIWVDDPSQRDCSSPAAARAHFKANRKGTMRIIKRRVVEETIPTVKP